MTITGVIETHACSWHSESVLTIMFIDIVRVIPSCILSNYTSDDSITDDSKCQQKCWVSIMVYSVGVLEFF